MGKKSKGRKKLQFNQQGIKPNTSNLSSAPKKVTTSQPNNTAAAEQVILHSKSQYDQVPGTNVYVMKKPVQPQFNVPPMYRMQPQFNVPPMHMMQPQFSAPPMHTMQPQFSVPPMHMMQPIRVNNQRPVTNANVNPSAAQSKCGVNPKKKKKTGNNIQAPVTNMNTKQLPVQPKGKVTPNQKQKTGNNIQGPGTSMSAKQQPVQSKCNVPPKNKMQPTGNNIQGTGTNVNTKQVPVQSKCNVTPNNKMQPTGKNIQGPGTNINTKQLPVQPKGKRTRRKKKKPIGNNSQGPGTNINTKQVSVQSKGNATPQNKLQPTGSNIQRPGTNINTKQVPVQSKGNATPQIKMQPTGSNIQGPCTNVNTKQVPVQSNSNVTPNNKMQPTGSNIQQLASKSDHTAGLQTSLKSQDSSAALTTRSGGAVIAAAPKQVIEVDLTDETTEEPPVKYVIVEPPKQVIEVDLTEEEETESNSTTGMVEVDSTNAARLLAAHPDILSDTSPNVWHKVIVKSAEVDRVAVLNAINRRIYPEKFTPHFFSMEDGHITFLVNNCRGALTELFKHNLKVPSPVVTFLTPVMELKVQLHAKKVNLFEILQKVISKRLNSEKTFLDLSKLTSIPDIKEMVYHTSQTSYLEELLKMAQEMAPKLVSLGLAGNNLSTLQHLSNVFPFTTKWRDSLKVLDLSDNKIDSTAEVMAFKTLRTGITELYLHRNPICGKYKEDAYIRVMRANFPHLMKLDGTYLQPVSGLPQWRPNYIFSSADVDSGELADQFVKHFFTLYDSDDRKKSLRGMYHEKAYFSLSSLYLPHQSTSHSARLSSYIADCRNLLHTSSKLRSKTTLCHGPDLILTRLNVLPRTQHDPYLFTVDLLHHSDKSAILTVTGVFKEKYPLKDTSSRHFMRTFVLIRQWNNEYRIVNDIVYITNATTEQAEAAFTYPKLPTTPEPPTTPKKIDLPRQVTENDKNLMAARYSELTGMTIDWSHKYLYCAEWDLRRALQTFISLFQSGKIPAFRFIKNQKKLQTCRSVKANDPLKVPVSL